MRKSHRLGKPIAAARNLAADVARRAKGPGKPTLSGEAKKNVQHAVQEALARVHGNQSKLSEVIGTSQGVISEWANGKSSPALPNIEELAHFLGRRVAEILEGDLHPLENAIAYWGPSTWPPPVLAEARRRAAGGEKNDAQRWKLILDELKTKLSRR